LSVFDDYLITGTSFRRQGGVMSILVKKTMISPFLLAVAAMVQADRATLNGTVTDSSAALVPGDI
jgi:hypothetical protein